MEEEGQGEEDWEGWVGCHLGRRMGHGERERGDGSKGVRSGVGELVKVRMIEARDV